MERVLLQPRLAARLRGGDGAVVVAGGEDRRVGLAGVIEYAARLKLAGKEVALLVDGVTKLDKVALGSAAEAETIRKMIIAMARDPRVLVIKVADRLHNMRTMRFLPPEKQARKARETITRKGALDIANLPVPATTSNTSEADYLEMVDKAKEYIRARARVFITGHEHNPRVEIDPVEDGCDLMMLAAGAAAGVSFSVAGGVSADSVEAVQQAGADVAVAGSAIYSASDVAAAAAAIRSAIS